MEEKTYTETDMLNIVRAALADTGIVTKDSYTESDVNAICHEMGLNPPSVKKLLTNQGNNGNEVDEDGIEVVVAEPEDEESNISTALIARTNILPKKLEKKSLYLEEMFAHYYDNCIASRAPLSEHFLEQLNVVLSALGYQKRDEKYIRLRKDSKKVDVLALSKEEDYLEYFLAENEEEVKTLAKPLENKINLYTTPKEISIIALIPTGVGYGAWHAYSAYNSFAAMAFGGLIGGVCGLIGVSGILPCNYKLDEKLTELDEGNCKHDDPYWAGLLGVTYPHVVGKLCYDVGNKARQIGYNLKRKKNLKALQAALEPAEHFTYEEK